MFLKLARQYHHSREEVDAMWQGLLEFEAEIMSQLGNTELIHG
jgi:tRNA-(ms[2]io[6]A)-hydroxylase